MRTVMIILGVVFLVLLLIVGGCFALLYWAHNEGQKTQEEFFQAVLSGEPSQVMEQFHPSLQEEVDAPVLGAWMAAVKENLGEFQGLSSSNFNTSSKVNNGTKTVETSGTVNFEKGDARSELKTMDDKIIAFEVQSEALPDNWFTKLDDVTLYDERARSFLKVLLDGGITEAMNRMHPSLREKFTEDGLEKGVQGLNDRLGNVTGMELTDQRFDAGPPQILTLLYRLDGEKEDLDAVVKFGAEGMKLHLTAFKIPAE